LRLARKHELADEEKRRTIADLRESGMVIERRQDPEVPFGVRAIESGIEVDGIWISRSNTPLTQSLKDLAVADRSSGSSLHSLSDSSTGAPTVEHNTHDTILQPVRPSWNLAESAAPSGFGPPVRTSIMGNKRLEYKPKRSSQLRFSSYGSQYDEATLDQLEGVSVRPKRPSTKSQRSKHMSKGEEPKDSSSDHADNERTSSSSESDLTVSTESKIIRHGSRQYHAIMAQTAEEADLQMQADALESVGTIVMPFSGDYSAVASAYESPHGSPNTSPRRSERNQYETVPTTQTPPIPPRDPRRKSAKSYVNEASALHQTLLPPARQRPLSPEFGAGIIHTNKAIRKVNSAFQVLPAGTFGPRMGSFADRVLRSPDPDSRPESPYWRRSPRADARMVYESPKAHKLQKKPPISATTTKKGYLSAEVVREGDSTILLY
jgi:hypothetical protein